MFKNKFEENYTLLNKLGEGCSSEVFKCQRKDLPNDTSAIKRAVKIIRSDDDEYMAISEREYELLKSLEHPYVVKVFDLVKDRGKLYMVMEYIEGKTVE